MGFPRLLAVLSPLLSPAFGATGAPPTYELALPKLAGHPALDARTAASDWRGAVSPFGFRTLGGELELPQPVVLLARDGEAVYLAARLPLPPGARPKAAVTAHDGPVWDDDAVELFLDPHPRDESYFQFIANAAGGRWESLGHDASYSAGWQATTQVGDGYWSVEMRVPFAALKVGPPAEGEVWGVNVGWDRQTPTPGLLTWAPVEAGFHDPTHFRRVAFLSGACPFTVSEIGDPRDGRFSVAGTSDVPAGRTLAARLTLTRPTGPEPGEATAALGPGDGRAFSLAAGLPLREGAPLPGRYEARLSLALTGGAGPPVTCADLAIPFAVLPQLEVTLRKYYLAEGKVVASVAVGALRQPRAETSVRVRLLSAGGEVRAEQQVAKLPAQGPAETTFSVADLPPGEYRVQAAALDRDGKQLATAEARLTRPAKPPWLGSREGLTDQVLAPWTPVKAEGRTVKVWGREYEFAGLPLPSRISSRDAALLAGPIRFAATVEGVAQVWQNPEARLGERKPAFATATTTALSAKLKLTSEVRVEYDGMIRSDLVLQPLAPVKLDSLVLEIPLPAARAKYLYHYPGRWGSAYNAGALPPEGFRAGFRPFVWLGDEDRGLAWFSESDRGFSPIGADNVVDISRQGDTVLLRVRIVGAPIELKEPLRYTFGLQATPVRPVTEDAWDFRICHHGDYGIESRTADAGASLTYPVAGNLNPARGTLEAWVRPHFDPNPKVAPDDPGRGRYNRDFFMLDFGGLRCLGFYWNVDDRGMRVYIKEGENYPLLFGTSPKWQKDEWHHVALTWGDAISIYVDGKLLNSAPYSGTLPDRLEGGTLRFGGRPSEFEVDELRISDIARTSFDLAQPPAADEHTLLLDRFDTAFTPDGEKPTTPVKGVPGRPDTACHFVEGRFGRALALYGGGAPRSTLDRLAELGVKTICFHEHWTDVQNYTSTTHGEALRKLVKACHEHGIRLLLYFGYELSNIAPEWDLYSDECLVAPQAGGYHRLPEQHAYIVCYRSPWQDFMAAGIAKMMDEYDIDGVYLDGTANPWGCANVHHGCGFVRPDGSLGTTYPFFDTREMMRRIYTLVKTRKPNGLVNVHQSTCMTIPTLAWATSYWDGEQFGGIEPGPWALEVLPLDTFRCEFMGRQWGVPSEMLCYDRPYTYRQAMSFSLLHDVLVRGSLGGSLELESTLWKAMDAFGRKQARFMPYWEDLGFARTNDPSVKVTAYSRGAAGAMLVVSNLGHGPLNVRVDLDRGKLGLPAGRPLAARDVVAGADLKPEGDALTFPLPSLDFRVIHVTPQG